jgi:hypothetical protein
MGIKQIKNIKTGHCRNKKFDNCTDNDLKENPLGT